MRLSRGATLTIGAALVALALVATGCSDDSTSGFCSAATCPRGCCEGDRCEPGPDGFCGLAGSSCGSWTTACTAQQECDVNSGVCVDLQCGPDTCPSGCCVNNECKEGTTTAACGRGGSACAVCQSEEVCHAAGQCVKQDQTCGPESCAEGCCAGNACMPGNTTAACGQSGGACQACVGDEECIAGTCAVPCSPATCEGCCHDDKCFEGTNPGLCGKDGSSCATCNPGQNCVDQACKTVPCNSYCLGCCDASDQCQLGNTEEACGEGGAACDECTGEEVCNGDRECEVPTVTCGPSNCSTGCCDGNTCVEPAQQDGTKCGSGGGACQACAATQECQSGVCKCTVASCASGCCDGETCRSGADNEACGTAGEDCDTCTGQEQCTDGDCTTVYDCATECEGCCDGNTCIANGATNNDKCGKGGVDCVECTVDKTCQDGICIGSGVCASCGAGTCCGASGCEGGTDDTSCGDNGEICQDCTTASLPMKCIDRKCQIDPDSLWKVEIFSVKLNSDFNFEGSQTDPKPWDKPDPFVEVWANYAGSPKKHGQTSTVWDLSYYVGFFEVVLTNIKAKELMPTSGGTPNFAVRVMEDDHWPNPNDDVAYCTEVTLTTEHFDGQVHNISECSACSGCYWPFTLIEFVSIRIKPM